MPVLEANELDDLQQEIAEVYAETMPDFLYIQRTVAGTRDAENPEVITAETVNKVYDDVPCYYEAASPRETQLVNQTSKSQLLSIEIAPTYSVKASDSGAIYAKGGQPAISFEVVGVIPESNGTSLTLLAEVVE